MFRRTLPLLAALALAPSAPAAVSGPRAAGAGAGVSARQAELKRAASLIAAHRLDEARTVLDAILRRDPRAYQAMNLEGVVRAEQGDAAGAERLFRAAVEGDPRLTGAQANLARLLLQTARVEPAQRQLETALKIAPKDPQLRELYATLVHQRALTALGGGENAKALDLLLGAKAVLPDDPQVQYEYAMVALQMRLFDEAAGALDTALRLRPEMPEALYALARVRLSQPRQNLTEAERLLRRYLALRPDDATAHYGLGYVLTLEEHPEQARAEFECSLALQPAQAESPYQLGEIALKEGREADAAAMFERALARDPRHAGALVGLGRIALQHKQYDKALDDLTRAAEADGSYNKAHYYLGVCYARLGRKADSERELARAAELDRSQREQSRVAGRLVRPSDAGAAQAGERRP